MNDKEALRKAKELYNNRKTLSRNPIFVKNIYNTIEKEFETKSISISGPELKFDAIKPVFGSYNRVWNTGSASISRPEFKFN